MLFRRVGIPAICDLLATVFESVALLNLIPSVWQMFSRSIIIFLAMLPVLYRHQKLRTDHWTGVSVTLLGIVIAQGLQAFQTVVEEMVEGLVPPVIGSYRWFRV
jgi:drug/metabolite transporter (DMT)-like permease